MPEQGTQVPLRFRSDELDLFGQASHDRNPLHLSDEYARRSPFGERVVFGILGALACLARLGDHRETVARQITLDFPSPLLLGIDYTVEVLEDSDEGAEAIIRDGQRLLLRVAVGFCESTPGDFRPGECGAERTEPADQPVSTLRPGSTVEGRWTPRLEPFQGLLHRFDLASKGIGARHVAALLCSSYLVGMEIPGRKALFSRLDLKFEPPSSPDHHPIDYRVEVLKMHTQFNLLSCGVTLETDGRVLASGEFRSFVRQDLPVAADETWKTLITGEEILEDQVGLVVGASRGLGAALAEALCWEGADVVASYARSSTEAMRLAERLTTEAPGSIALEQGDACDPQWCTGLAERITARYGKLNFLVCNACPPLLPSWLEPQALDRIHDHVSRSLLLVLTPLSVFSKLIADNDGTIVVISSHAVTQPVKEWPHYVSAKAALEGLTRVAALEYPSVRFLVPRPPRLLTDLTNTPVGAKNALDPAMVAMKIVHRMAASRATASAGSVEYLEDFREA